MIWLIAAVGAAGAIGVLATVLSSQTATRRRGKPRVSCGCHTPREPASPETAGS